MKYILLGLFLLHACFSAPVENESIEDAANSANIILPQTEDKIIEANEPEKEAKSDEETEKEGEDAEAAFFGMMNPMMMNPMMMGGMGPMMGGMGPMMGGMGPMMGGMGPMMGGMGPMMGGMPFNGMDPMMMGPMGMGGMDHMMGMGGMNPMMMGPMGMGGMNPMMMGGMNPMGGHMDPMMMNQMMGGMNPMGGHMDPMMMNQMMGGMNPMVMDPMMGGMNQMMMNPMMMGMTGYSPINYMEDNSSPVDPNKKLAQFHEYKNEDYPVDYTLPCSNHCACEQVCRNMLSPGPCNCRCPPKCIPGLTVKKPS